MHRTLSNFRNQILGTAAFPDYANELRQLKDCFSPWMKDLTMKPLMVDSLSAIVRDQQLIFDNLKGMGNILKDQSRGERLTYGDRMNDFASAFNLQGLGNALKGPREMMDNVKMLHGFPKFNGSLLDLAGLPKAFQWINVQLASTIAQRQRWDELEDFKNLNQKAAEIIEEVTSGQLVAGKVSDKFDELIAVAKDFIKRNKKYARQICRFVDIILTIVGLINLLLPQPSESTQLTRDDLAKLVTKDDLRKELAILRDELEVKPDIRCVNRPARIMFRPSTKTLVQYKAQAGFEVVVLQVNHRWVYVSYLNPELDLPQTGWILKKYVSVN